MAKHKHKFTWEKTEITTKYEYSDTVVDGDDPKEIKTDSKLFNGQEWYEVKLMIKECLDKLNPDPKNAEKKTHAIEDSFKEKPKNVASRKDVYKYIIEKLQ